LLGFVIFFHVHLQYLDDIYLLIQDKQLQLLGRRIILALINSPNLKQLLYHRHIILQNILRHISRNTALLTRIHQISQHNSIDTGPYQIFSQLFGQRSDVLNVVGCCSAVGADARAEDILAEEVLDFVAVGAH